MKIASLTIWMLFVGAAYADQRGNPSVTIGGAIENPGPRRLLSTPESLAELLNRVGIKITKSDYSRYQDGKAVADTRIRLYRDNKLRSFSIDPKRNDLWNIQIQADDFVEISRAPFGGVFFSVELKLKKADQGEQDGTEQPATRSESKSKGKEKLQPEAERRSR